MGDLEIQVLSPGQVHQLSLPLFLPLSTYQDVFR